MNELLHDLYFARLKFQELKLKEKELKAKFENSVEFCDIMRQEVEETGHINSIEKQIEQAGMDKYLVDAVKTNPGYVVKETKKVVLKNVEYLREWCIHNFRPALKLDEKMVNDAAKTGAIPQDYFELFNIPQLQISSNLSEFSGEKQE